MYVFFIKVVSSLVCILEEREEKWPTIPSVQLIVVYGCEPAIFTSTCYVASPEISHDHGHVQTWVSRPSLSDVFRTAGRLSCPSRSVTRIPSFRSEERTLSPTGETPHGSRDPPRVSVMK